MAPPAAAAAAAAAVGSSTSRLARDVAATPDAEDDTSQVAKAAEPSTVARWREMKPDEDGRLLISDGLYPLADGELLVQVYENGGKDEDAMSAPRRKITGRSVVLTTNALEPLICHWGVAKEEPGEWVLAPKRVHPSRYRGGVTHELRDAARGIHRLLSGGSRVVDPVHG